MNQPQKSRIIYVHRDGVEFPASQDDQFSGRVQSDKDVLREGRIRLHVSRLRTEDSGLYLCDVKTEDGFNTAKCRLNVTAAADQIQTQRPTLTPEPERGETRTNIIAVTVTVAAALIFVIINLIIFLILRRKISCFKPFLKTVRSIDQLLSCEEKT
uniref:Immunoglobulin V-set domain-containing protein n=1 Tax=Poecilia formosa TaxID=48698 RepID=A0A096M4U6_POEFO